MRSVQSILANIDDILGQLKQETMQLVEASNVDKSSIAAALRGLPAQLAAVITEMRVARSESLTHPAHRVVMQDELTDVTVVGLSATEVKYMAGKKDQCSSPWTRVKEADYQLAKRYCAADDETTQAIGRCIHVTLGLGLFFVSHKKSAEILQSPALSRLASKAQKAFDKLFQGLIQHKRDRERFDKLPAKTQKKHRQDSQHRRATGKHPQKASLTPNKPFADKICLEMQEHGIAIHGKQTPGGTVHTTVSRYHTSKDDSLQPKKLSF